MRTRSSFQGKRSFRLSRLRLAAVGTALAMGLAACGSGGEGATPAAEESGTPVEGGTIVAALAGDPQTLDVAQNSGALTIYVGQNVFEQLFQFDETLTPRPMLAEDYTMSDDGLTYTIPLREGITFHNGEPMTAEDVVASLERWMVVSGPGKLVAEDVESITATDDATVEIVLNKPRYSLISDLAAYVQAAIIVPAEIAQAAGDQPMADDQIIGTGPFKLGEYTHGQRIVLEKNPEYTAIEEDWGGFAGAKRAYADELEFRFVADPTQQLNGLQTGQFHWAQSVSPDQYEAIKDNPALTVEVTDTGLVSTVLLNHDPASPFSDLKARQAMNMLIDKEAMSRAAFGPDILWTPLSGSFAFEINEPMYSDAGQDVYETYDPDQAKELFTEAGVTADTPIRIATTQTYEKYYQMAVVMQAQLEEIGLTAQVDVFDFPTMIDRLTTAPTSWDISMTGFSGIPGAPSQVNYLTPTWPGGYKSPKMDALLAEYNQATSADEAHDIVDQIQQTVWDEIPVIPISPNKSLQVSSSKLQNLSTFRPGVFWNTWLAG
ncbi:ABC transporter substrate-binding protein [Blastococcus xanthinilyticus]|uniref:Peptide/nickel transport system substrate-binding protein n=1 Tax=Blastococcus xanthinilyticus TaxID=1564164 RepID=A0A5S5D0N8_9ACTN|nr:ABC transporter substrate-binding protein [Blastococcus xanthinilyticus]TYP89591.1 peptide/nickel transport system substrate-binding protein [Blastococcus xanthinilyticus]